MFRRKQAFQLWSNKIFFATGDNMLTSYFRVCILWVLLLKTDIGEMLKQTNWSLCWLNPKYANPSHNFPLWTAILNFADVGKHTHTHQCMNVHLPAIRQTAWYCWSFRFVLFKHFIPSIFSCLCIVQKNLAQICCSITLADTQTFLSKVCFQW